MHNMCFVLLFSATMIVNRDKRLNIRCRDEILDQLLRVTNAVDTRTPADRDRFYAMAIKGHIGTRNDKGVPRIHGDSPPLDALKTERSWREEATDGRRRFAGLYSEKGSPIRVELVLEEPQRTEKKRVSSRQRVSSGNITGDQNLQTVRPERVNDNAKTDQRRGQKQASTDDQQNSDDAAA